MGRVHDREWMPCSSKSQMQQVTEFTVSLMPLTLSFREEQISTTLQNLETRWASHQGLRKAWSILISVDIKKITREDSLPSLKPKKDGKNSKRSKRQRRRQLKKQLKLRKWKWLQNLLQES